MSVIHKFLLYKQLRRKCESNFHISTKVICEDNNSKVTQCEVCGKIAYSIAYDPGTQRVHQLPPYWHFENIDVITVSRVRADKDSNFGHLFNINTILTGVKL